MLEKALRSSEKPVSPLHLHGEDAVPDPVSFPGCQEGGVAAEAQRQHELLGGGGLLTHDLSDLDFYFPLFLIPYLIIILLQECFLELSL